MEDYIARRLRDYRAQNRGLGEPESQPEGYYELLEQTLQELTQEILKLQQQVRDLEK